MICSPKPCVFSCKFAVIYKKDGSFFIKCTYPGKHCWMAEKTKGGGTPNDKTV